MRALADNIQRYEAQFGRINDDQPNFPSLAPPLLEKNQVAGVSSKLGLEMIPVAETNKKLLFLSRIVEDVSLNEKLSLPVMVHSGLIGLAVEKSQDWLKFTDWPPGMMRNDPESLFVSEEFQDFTPVAAARSLVATPFESWSVT